MSMERVRVEEFGESSDEDCGWVNLVFLKDFSLQILSSSSQHFMGIRVFIIVCMRNAKSQFQLNRVFWQLKLVTWTSHEFESRANCLARLEVLSCSAPTVMTFSSFACFTRVPPLATCQSRASHKIQSWDSTWVHTSWVFFTLSHTLPLHNSHLNTRYLISKLQVNTWLNKFNLTISSFGYSMTKP